MTPLALFQVAAPADPAELRPLYEQAVQRRIAQSGPTDVRTVQAMRDLGMFLLLRQDFAAAAQWLQRVVGVGGSPADQEALGDALLGGGNPDAAAEAFRGAGSPSALAKWAGMLEAAGKKEEAVAAFRQSLALETSDARIAVRLNDIALLTREESLFRRALAIQRKTLGSRHPELAATMNNLATLLLEKRRLPEAEALARESLAILRATLGPYNIRTGVGASNLADVLWAAEKHAEARRQYEAAYSIFLEGLGPQHPWTVEAKAGAEAGRR